MFTCHLAEWISLAGAALDIIMPTVLALYPTLKHNKPQAEVIAVWGSSTMIWIMVVGRRLVYMRRG